jgi:pimeloyl-ACP methyl ester carboxylesterase
LDSPERKRFSAAFSCLLRAETLLQIARMTPKTFPFGTLPLAALLSVFAFPGCQTLRELGRDLAFMDHTAIVSGRIANAQSHSNVYAMIAEWNPETHKIASADFAAIRGLGVFGFYVSSKRDQYVSAFSDSNGDGHYEKGEPAWIHLGADGKPAPVDFDDEGKARTAGTLSPDTILPDELVDAARRFLGGRTAAEAATGWKIPVALGEIADLSDPKFSTKQGEAGLWHPASFPMKSGIGIYFLEKYDPDRTPVLFIYGAAGSPQDWMGFFEKFDRKRYQLWFCHYPTGRRLDETAAALNRGITILHEELGFQRLDVVAHSMGGLLARGFIVKNAFEDGNHYIHRFVSISTPWGGVKSAALGVKRSPEVVPSWRDVAPGSDYQKMIFRRHLRGRIPHLLLYSHKASRALTLPKENDGAVAVASELAPPAVKDAAKVIGFDETHTSILSNPEVIRDTRRFLDGSL